MASKIWLNSLEDIQKSPYDYTERDKFKKEAKDFLGKLYPVFVEKYNLKFHKNDRSVEKAIYILQTDALDTLKECIDMIVNKKHRIVGKMFRDILEALDLAALFYGEGAGGKHLSDWYDGNVILHCKYRDFLKKNSADSQARNVFYKSLSEWTHHNYRPLLNSYTLGVGDMIVFDGYSDLLITPQTLSEYEWMLAQLILMFIKEVSRCGLIDKKEVCNIFREVTK